MDTRYYQAQGIDIELIANELEQMLLMQRDHVQHFGNKDLMTVQIKKGDDWAAIVGMQSAVTLTMQRTQEGVQAMIGQQKWMDKAAVGVVGMLVLWPLAFTAGAGAIQQAQLGGQVLGSLDMLMRQHHPDVQIGPASPGMIPGASHYSQQFSPTVPPLQQTMPTTHGATCGYCHAENLAGARFCMSCGHSLAPQETPKVLF